VDADTVSLEVRTSHVVRGLVGLPFRGIKLVKGNIACTS
jgi:hypothetical protein